MYYVYVLKSKADGHLYTGCTKNLKARLEMHNCGNVESTKNRMPFVLVYYEAFLNKNDAFAREQWLKTGWGRNHLSKILKNYLKNLGG
ncbi:GIY-YIG nuclease family protein [Candidatus Giovannonibacteria bacterium]|nr:GIY-YIG nuclease family protein [Candidatus Giovannonibacteria bacterium]